METLYLLIPIAAFLVVVAVGLFLWSIKSGQFEDLEGPGFKILMDDDKDMIPDDARLPEKNSPKKNRENVK